ncbi:hypothetical protein [Cellulomonas soli]|uniref:Uncharacterized protein n=1 Tax=Cellulomonas soli TaxID=931535 RepID=A0A512PGL6_9CELL|nr:hypothetical protein [Cellulomonas soli]NYI58190.1 hypothetical protein [Cellulomonas soli]GEP70323.1 hypothetical protein CSO01_30380 [Cellulomonas soli]
MIPFQTYDDEMDQVAAGGAIFMVFIIIFYAAIFAFAAYMATRVAKKAGYNQWMGLLYLVPVANFVMLIMFVFQKWPIERELEQARAAGFVPYPQLAYPQAGYPQAAYPQAAYPVQQAAYPGQQAAYGTPDAYPAGTYPTYPTGGPAPESGAGDPYGAPQQPPA